MKKLLKNKKKKLINKNKLYHKLINNSQIYKTKYKNINK